MSAEPATISDLLRALEARELTAEEVTERCLSAIADKDPALNAFISVFEDEARDAARAADRALAAGNRPGRLHGVPLSIKDLIDIEGRPTTAASRVRASHVAHADAPVVTRLRNAGAVLIGKTNLHEFALGTTNEESAYGPVKHPLDPARSPGGSSGGSAASVLARMAFGSLGTDTGGSVRIPAAACGLVGLKPGFGEITTAGVVPLSTTLDHVGVLCRSVADAALLYDVLTDEKAGPVQPVSGALTLAVPGEYFTAVLDPQVASTFAHACDRLRDAGVTLEEVAIPHASDIAPIYLHIILAEAAAYHAKTLENRADDYTAPVRLRLEMGRYILAEDYVRARRGALVLREEVDRALDSRHALLLPSLAVPATRLGAVTVRISGVEEPIRNLMLRLTQLFNLTGHPALTLPCGKTIDGLPVGAQLVARRTPALLGVGQMVERYLGPGTSR